MATENKIRQAEGELWKSHGMEPEETYVELPRAGCRVRVLSMGKGPDVVLLHGVSLSSAIWTPLASTLSSYRLHAIDLPGHSVSGSYRYQAGQVRPWADEFVSELLEALGVVKPAVIGHSLGGQVALWHAAEHPEAFTSLILIGAPSGAIPGVQVKMPLSLMTIPGFGRMMLASPAPRFVYRKLLAQGIGRSDAAAASAGLISALHKASSGRGNAGTVASLMRAINTFRHPRQECVLSPDDLLRVRTPTLFLWGTEDPYLSPEHAQPSVAAMPNAQLIEVPGAHMPWLTNCADIVKEIRAHLAATDARPSTNL